MLSAPPLPIVNGERSANGLFVPTSSIISVLVKLLAAHRFNLPTVKLVEGVPASMVTTLEMAFVIQTVVILLLNVLSGGLPPDQLVPMRQRPSVGLIQALSARAGVKIDSVRKAMDA